MKLPVAFLALPVGTALLSVGGVTLRAGMDLGLVAVYAAILGDMYLRAAVNTYRFWTDDWKAVARRSNVGADLSDD